MSSIADHLLRILGHAPIPGAYRVLWRLRRPALRNQKSAAFEISFNGLRYRGRLDDLNDWHIFFFGSYSPQELDFLAYAARIKKQWQEDITYFDVGANVGQHALFMSQHATHVLAFEPSRAVRGQFEANVALNGIHNIRIFPFALGDSNGEGLLGSGFAGNSGSRSLTWTLDESKMETVAVRNGDEFLRQEKLPHMDILKLDVEGYEKRVLDGLRNTIFRDRPIILMELIGQSEKSGFRDQAELSETLYPDHVLFTLQGRKRARLTRFNWVEEAVVCLPQEHLGRFRSLIQAAQ